MTLLYKNLMHNFTAFKLPKRLKIVSSLQISYLFYTSSESSSLRAIMHLPPVVYFWPHLAANGSVHHATVKTA